MNTTIVIKEFTKQVKETYINTNLVWKELLPYIQIDNSFIINESINNYAYRYLEAVFLYKDVPDIYFSKPALRIFKSRLNDLNITEEISIIKLLFKELELSQKGVSLIYKINWDIPSIKNVPKRYHPIIRILNNNIHLNNLLQLDLSELDTSLHDNLEELKKICHKVKVLKKLSCV